MTVEILDLRDSEKQRLQRLADRLAEVKARIAELSAQEDTIRDELWDVLDGITGPNTYAIFEAMDPHRGWRMVREISQRRSFDLGGLHAALTAKSFKAVTKLVVDTQALDVALRRGDLPADIVERYTTYTPTPRGPLWKPAAGDIHLEPGQLAIVRP